MIYTLQLKIIRWITSNIKSPYTIPHWYLKTLPHALSTKYELKELGPQLDLLSVCTSVLMSTCKRWQNILAQSPWWLHYIDIPGQWWHKQAFLVERLLVLIELRKAELIVIITSDDLHAARTQEKARLTG